MRSSDESSVLDNQVFCYQRQRSFLGNIPALRFVELKTTGFRVTILRPPPAAAQRRVWTAANALGRGSTRNEPPSSREG